MYIVYIHMMHVYTHNCLLLCLKWPPFLSPITWEIWNLNLSGPRPMHDTWPNVQQGLVGWSRQYKASGWSTALFLTQAWELQAFAHFIIAGLLPKYILRSPKRGWPLNRDKLAARWSKVPFSAPWDREADHNDGMEVGKAFQVIYRLKSRDIKRSTYASGWIVRLLCQKALDWNWAIYGPSTVNMWIKYVNTI